MEADGTVSATAFMLRGPKEDRPAEPGLSVNWMENTGVLGKTDQLKAILHIFIQKGRTVRKKLRICSLKCGEIAGIRAAPINRSRELIFKHEPVAGIDDTHAGIYGYSYLENAIATLLALSVDAVTRVSQLD